ncbi:MAG: winged helix-turn-helix transcriptional regulator [Tabrizicola sp.]|nr:winged helix-turn-helix transcriptional regulator [Tabrizicola sp.]
MNALDVLGDPVRRRILELLAETEHSSGDVVKVIHAEFGITQAAVSQQLRVLRENGFARVRPDGAKRIYAVETAPFQEIDQWLERFRGHWEPKLQALDTEVARGKRKHLPTRGAE